MYTKTFTSCLFLFLFSLSNLYPQYNGLNSAGTAPWAINNGNSNMNPVLPNQNSVGYAYYMTQNTYCQLFKFKIGAPGDITLIGDPTPHLLGNGDYANPTGVWKYYVQEMLLSPFIIYEVDTATGNLTNVGFPINIRSGHKPLDMEWDHTTNTMYLLSSNNDHTETQLYTMDWQTKVLTWIGPLVTSPGGIAAGGFNANGTYFGCDVSTNTLWKVNKYTGAWTLVGPLGIDAWIYQDGGFDRADFSKMLLCSTADTIGLYQVDTATGLASMIGSFPMSDPGMAFCIIPSMGPQISHTPLQNTTNVSGPYAVNASVLTHGTGIAVSKLYWSRNNTAITDSISMTNTGGNNWSGNIPGNGLASTYRYYIYVKDSLNRSVAAPFNAPVSLYTFFANANDTIKPVINHTPLGNIPKYLWPDSIYASVTDNIGIDSVWVRWRINSNSAKHVKLLNTFGSIYKGVFNSITTDVNPGDTIYYRIIAQDNFANHNKDSTPLISFTITSSTYSCIGTGTIDVWSGSPFYTYFNGYKEQLLWTAAEISGNGGLKGNILQLGFYVIATDHKQMNNFNIKMQNTPLPMITNGFISSGWSTAYTGSYTVQGTGWQFVDLQTPFYWDGESNLLVEFCFGNTSYSTGTRVRGTTATAMLYYTHFDDTLGLACSTYKTGWGLTERPNVCFSIMPSIGTGNNTSKIPISYKLYQNYPNPFNPETRISFEIPKQGFVSLKIYDILGREVKILVNEVKSAGAYSIDFNAAYLSSGIYLCRMECPGYADTKRMILLK